MCFASELWKSPSLGGYSSPPAATVVNIQRNSDWFFLLSLEWSELDGAWSLSSLRLQLFLRSEEKWCLIGAKHQACCLLWLGEGWSQADFWARLLACGLLCHANKSSEKRAVGLFGRGRSLCHALEKGFRSNSFRKQA